MRATSFICTLTIGSLIAFGLPSAAMADNMGGALVPDSGTSGAGSDTVATPVPNSSEAANPPEAAPSTPGQAASAPQTTLPPTAQLPKLPPPVGFRLTSPSFKMGDDIPNAQISNENGCTGGNISPAMKWQGVPATAKSLAITVVDMNGPDNQWFWHWLVFNLPPSTTSLPAGASGNMPGDAMEGMNGYGKIGYGGPCPPAGSSKSKHRYMFTVWALSTPSLNEDPNVTGQQFLRDITTSMVGMAI